MDTNYGISMNSILRMDILHDARLLAGASGTDQIVTSVSVMVDPNIVIAVTWFPPPTPSGRISPNLCSWSLS